MQNDWQILVLCIRKLLHFITVLRPYQIRIYGKLHASVIHLYASCITMACVPTTILIICFAFVLPILLGVDKVVIYKNSCGSELDRLLQVYIEDDFVEKVPWPIDKNLVLLHDWLHSVSGGDMHYLDHP